MSRNGASLLLLQMLRWLKQHGNFQIDVVSDGHGPLVEDFRAIASVTIVSSMPYPIRLLPSRWARPVASAWLRAKLRALTLGRRYDLVYANTAAVWPYVAALGDRPPPLIWHIHELPYALGLTLPDDGARGALRAANRVVAVSRAVAQALSSGYAVRPECIDQIYGFVPDEAPSLAIRAELRAKVRHQLGLPEDAFVVGGCGGLGWRKGTDLFLQIARLAQRADGAQRVHFLWVGGAQCGSPEAMQFDFDVKQLGLEAVCCRVPATADVSAYYCAMDAFALTSREDPFPLVALEAATHRLPVVCFAMAGGTPEFVAGDAGRVVPYLNLTAFVAALRELACQPELGARLGEAGRQRVLREHSIDAQGPRLLRSVERCLEAA
ncbi:glycosyltransferase involved in cell wall biosynthesis [Rivibacter subsaxonicus]|uniref:Glycosyltransferase involved in cell wall biosynthesis n=2 Tax=Rivibacter subsaxonicus TaxID=457575 RepID=A0A4Q7VVW5_9BURK|nr:glycosyltransferase involved in cell wall biosynthesis [Rivibacter subsaxonicus]